MARIFRQTYTKLLPADAQVFTRKGRRCARFKDRRGRTQTAPLSADGAKIIVEAAKWYIDYRDASGNPCRVPGFTDKQATVQLAAELERQAARRESGLVDRFAEHRKRPLREHLDDWRKALLTKSTTEKHVNLVVNRATAVINGCGFRCWGDLCASPVETFIAERGQDGLSVQSCNFYLQSMKQFCRWMVRDGRAPDSPLAHLSGRNVKTDRRHDRRALEPEELRRLLETARVGPMRNGVPGPERAVLYQLSAETGFRAGELRTLTWGRVHLDSEHPTITIKAAYSKRRRDDVQPLAASTVEMLKLWREAGGPCVAEDPVIPNLKRWTRTADMTRADLRAARETWLEEAATDQERSDRQASYFLCYEDRDGRVADFHSLRHTYITNLVRGGVQPKVAQQLARHSTITLTMDRYTHVVLLEKAEALRVLPQLSPSESASDRKQATGTD